MTYEQALSLVGDVPSSELRDVDNPRLREAAKVVLKYRTRRARGH